MGRFRVIKSFWQKQAYVSGFQPSTLVRTLRRLPTFARDLKAYNRANALPSFQIRLRDVFPILTDMDGGAGVAGGHYFHQDLWAARKIFQRRPPEHFDIGSRTDGFVAHLLTFMPVTVIDIRPLVSKLEGLTFVQDDASELSRMKTDSANSLSSLHVAEHFGLGRYTDPIDPGACFRFMSSLGRVLAVGGTLYFSVPVGRERVEFNAHRVFSTRTILEHFAGLELVSFSFVSDEGDLYQNTDPLAIPSSELACGLFEFTKTKPTASQVPCTSRGE